MNEDKNHNISDDLLREAFHRQLPQAPKSPWFTRKVMNRLPERQRRAVSIIEWLGYLVAVVILGVYWVRLYCEVSAAMVVTVSNIVSAGVLTIMTASLIGFVAISMFRRV